jgi:hypothetical protein
VLAPEASADADSSTRSSETPIRNTERGATHEQLVPRFVDVSSASASAPVVGTVCTHPVGMNATAVPVVTITAKATAITPNRRDEFIAIDALVIKWRVYESPV